MVEFAQRNVFQRIKFFWQCIIYGEIHRYYGDDCVYVKDRRRVDGSSTDFDWGLHRLAAAADGGGSRDFSSRMTLNVLMRPRALFLGVRVCGVP